MGLIAGVLLVGGLTYNQMRPVEVHYIQSGTIFDMTDRRQVAGYANHVVIGIVKGEGVTRTKDGPPRTTFQVEVVSVLKGDVKLGVVSIGQTGVELSGKDITLIEGVEQLLPGQKYVLAVRNEGAEFTLLSGPFSPEKVEAGANVNGTSTISAWAEAVRDQRWPTHLPRE